MFKENSRGTFQAKVILFNKNKIMQYSEKSKSEKGQSDTQVIVTFSPCRHVAGMIISCFQFKTHTTKLKHVVAFGFIKW